MFYSQSTQQILNPALRHLYEAAGTWPDDAKEATAAELEHIRSALAVVPFAVEATSYLDGVRATRETILNRLAGIGLAAMVSGDVALTDAVAQARQALLDITAVAEVTAANTIEQLRAAVEAEFERIAQAAPEIVRKAIDGENV